MTRQGFNPIHGKDEIYEDYNSEITETFISKSSMGECQFEDFKIMCIVGKGTCGKVYLVRNKFSGKFYAMKSIRKDIVIDNNSIESLHLEKLILLQVNNPFIIGMEQVFVKPYRVYFVMDFIQ